MDSGVISKIKSVSSLSVLNHRFVIPQIVNANPFCYICSRDKTSLKCRP